MFVINTDQGYITSGLPHDNLQFGLKEDAKPFTFDELREFGQSLAIDLHRYYCCTHVGVEEV